MTKTLSLVVVLVSLQGCMYQTVNSYDIYRARELCGSIDSVVEISAHFLGDERTICKNGKSIWLSNYREE